VAQNFIEQRKRFMELFDPLGILQKAQLANHHYNKSEFLRLVDQLDDVQFDAFCQQIARIANTPEPGQAPVADIGGQGNADPVASWDLKGIEIDEAYAENNPVGEPRSE
jgi:hypothetical protein